VGDPTWRALPTTLTATGFTSVVDDERLPKGRYRVRARAVDLAGNERTADRMPNGRAATLALPLRVKTRLVVGRQKRVRVRNARRGRRFRTVIVAPRSTRYGRTIPLRGRLTTPGANPLAGADLEVWQRRNLPGAAWTRIGTVRTTRSGR
jgi:hypothetical protein